MECNRDEAVRAKSIADTKLENRDFAGAKKFATKAQSLYPGLDGVSQLLTTVDVYISAENKVNGEIDWYGVLGVHPSADDDTIKKQYRKFALMLHPDKNKSVGADGAFTLIKEAWTLLSDKAKRLAYNQRRGFTGFQQRVPMQTPGPSSAPPHRTNGGYPNYSNGAPPSVPKPPSNFAKVPVGPTRKASVGPTRKASVGPTRKVPVPPTTNTAPPAKPTPQRTDTFWTICRGCKMHYEYLKIYLNQTLLCANCQEAFLASETPPPKNHAKSSNVVLPQQRQQTSSDQTTRGDPVKNAAAVPFRKPGPTTGQASSGSVKNAATAAAYQKPGPTTGQANSGPFKNAAAAGHSQKPGPTTGQASSASVKHSNLPHVPIPRPAANVGKVDPSIATKAANVVKQAHDKLKRAYTESHTSNAGWEESVKRRKLDEQFRSGVNSFMMAQRNGGGFGIGTNASARAYGFSGNQWQPLINREMTPVETRNMLMAKSKKEIMNKINEWEAEKRAKAEYKEKNKEKRQKVGNASSAGQDQNGGAESLHSKKHETKDSADTDAVKEADAPPALTSMTVPDPDFHDFDLDRAESSFGENEVWAAYDDDDGMPRFYALINKVVSRHPFKLRVNWLNSKTTKEFGPLDWVGSGFYKTCGEFWVGKTEGCKTINSFSQKVNFTKGPRGSILIFPQKGDVWALYENWSPDWSANTPDEVVHKYEMVMVLEDYVEGVSVAPLVKVVGFKTVFCPDLDREKVKKIGKEEMFRFSHRVPHHLLSREEARNAPEGCVELDPAATPLELLQVVMEAGAVKGGNGNVEEKD